MLALSLQQKHKNKIKSLFTNCNTISLNPPQFLKMKQKH